MRLRARSDGERGGCHGKQNEGLQDAMSREVAGATRLTAELDRAAVSLTDSTLDVVDLVLLGTLRGDWLELEQRAREGLALSDRPGRSVHDKDVHAAATSFRYAQDLISAEEFLRWLRERALTVADLAGFLRRRLLREAAAQAADAAAPEPSAVDDTVLAEILWTEAICSGMLASLATAAGDLLIAGAIAARRDGDPDPSSRRDVPTDVLKLAASDAASGLAERSRDELATRLGRLVGLQLAMARLRDDLDEPAALERVIAAHGLEWLGVSGTELEFTTEGAAREAGLMLGVDGLDAETVSRLGAGRCPGPPRLRHLLIADAPPELAGALAACAPGEVVGPWSEADRHRVLLVDGKRPPALGTPALRDAAIDERLAEVLNREGAGRLERPLAV
jgi:hypothetical protein